MQLGFTQRSATDLANYVFGIVARFVSGQDTSEEMLVHLATAFVVNIANAELLSAMGPKTITSRPELKDVITTCWHNYV